MSAYEALARYYDELTGDVPYERYADFYELIFKAYSVSPGLILDLACGTGTLTGILAGRGYEMIGVDGSMDMLSAAMDKPVPPGAVAPLYLCQEMEELDLFGTVSAAVCSLDGINYLPPESLSEVFRRLRLFIEPGGVFVFDINTPEKLTSLDGQVFIDETDDVYCVWRAELDREENALCYGMDVFSLRPDGAWDRSGEEHTEYIHTEESLIRELEAQGFGDISVRGELVDAPPAQGEQRVFIAARRMP